MGSGIFFPISGLAVILIIIITFNIKGHINNTETHIYNALIITNLIGLIIEILCYFACKIHYEHPILSNFILKSYLVYLITWTAIFTTYIFKISVKNRGKIYKLGSQVLYFTSIFMIYLLPIQVIIKDNFKIFYTVGLCVNFSYIISFIYVMIILIVIIKNIENIKNEKYLPVFVFFVIGTISILIQKFFPQILVLTFAETIICLCMYFTIENPDLKMIKELNLAKDKAEKANRAKSDFLSSMSHEIRTPLNAIVGFSEIIKTEDTLENAKKDADDIIMASNNLLEIVNGILDISKIEANKMEIVNKEYKLVPELNNIAKLMIPRIGEKPIELKTDFSSDIPAVMYGDIGKIKEIIVNFLTNAVKYTEQGEINFKVSCINNNNYSTLVISISDTGRGIPKEKIKSLFNKFNRIDEDKNTTIEGTGLGLAITKSFVEMLGGKIIVQSEYGQGSKFTVYLRQKIISFTTNEEQNEENTVEENIDFSMSKVLVVDDNNLNLKIINKILNKYGIFPELIDNGFDCLEKIENGEKYDLILLDDMMPKMRGTVVFDKLKLINDFKTPVVILTANALNEMKDAYLKQGFNDYLSKPIDKEELYRVLKTYLNKNNKVSLNKESLNNSELEILDSNENVKDVQKRVLIVDDNKINVKIAVSLLKKYNLIVDEALSGEECLNKVKQKKYDLIFMDIMMPEMNGVEVLRKLKEDTSFNVPTVALTADALVGSREKYLKAGFVEYISKPIDSKLFDQVVLKFLGLESNEKGEKESSISNTDFLIENGINYNSALELLGDKEMYNDTLKDFISEINEKLKQMEEYKNSNNCKDYSILAHSLKSDSKYLGFTSLSEIALEHELKGKDNDAKFIEENFDVLKDETNKFVKIANEYLQKEGL